MSKGSTKRHGQGHRPTARTEEEEEEEEERPAGGRCSVVAVLLLVVVVVLLLLLFRLEPHGVAWSLLQVNPPSAAQGSTHDPGSGGGASS